MHFQACRRHKNSLLRNETPLVRFNVHHFFSAILRQFYLVTNSRSVFVSDFSLKFRGVFKNPKYPPPVMALVCPELFFIRATRVLAMVLCLSVCLSHVGVLSKRPSESSWFLACRLISAYPTLCYLEIQVYPKKGTSL